MSEHVATAMLGIVGIVCLLAFLARGGSCHRVHRCHQGNLASMVADLQQELHDLKRDRAKLREEFTRLRARLTILETTGLSSAQRAQFIELQTTVTNLNIEVRRLRRRMAYRKPWIVITRKHYRGQMAKPSWIATAIGAIVGLVIAGSLALMLSPSTVNVTDGINSWSVVVSSLADQPRFYAPIALVGLLFGGFIGGFVSMVWNSREAA